MLSFPKGWENIPASLDPLVLVTLSSLIVGPVSPPACLSSYEGANASSAPVDRIGEGGDGGSAGEGSRLSSQKWPIKCCGPYKLCPFNLRCRKIKPWGLICV